MERLVGREELLAASVPTAMSLAPPCGHWRRIAFDDLGARPRAVPAEAVREHAGVAGREHFGASVAVPVADEQAMDDAEVLVGDGLDASSPAAGRR